MKITLRLCSVLLVISLLANMLPMSIFAEEFRESLTAAPESALEVAETSDAQIVAEIPSKRTQYTKEFMLSNGLHLAAVYPDAVHYEKDGSWEEIDNTLTAKADGTYSNTAGVWNVSFPQQLSGSKSITLEKDGYTLSFAMAGELRSSGELVTAAIGSENTSEQLSVSQMQTSSAAIQQINKAEIRASYQYAETAPEKLYSRLTYSDVYQNTDVIYDMDSNRVKESIVMESYSSTLRGYKYNLNVGQMIPILEDDGQITFYDADQKNVVMVMPAPYLVDAAEESNRDVQVQLTGKGSTYTLTYLLPTQWLAAAERSWPVILDPVVTASLSISNIKDDTVSEKNEYGYENDFLEAGHSNSRGISRIYLMYQNLPQLTSSDVIVAATVQLQKKVDGETVSLEVHKVNGTWTSSTINWSNKPAYNQNIEDYAIVDAAGRYTWIITDVVRDWYANQNTGMMFKVSDAEEAARDNRYKQFYSSDQSTTSRRPTLAIIFRNNNGLESYWDYTSSSAGRAGTGYINNFTGNMTWIHNDIGFGGNRMPVSIQHIYNLNDAIVPTDSNNSNDSGGNSFGMGYGWRTNYNQLVYRWNVKSSFYIWEDADGTDHYFQYDSTIGKYKDEDGLELTLTDTGSGTTKYCITDRNGNCSYFDTSGRLTKLQNNQATKSNISITYTTATGKLISTITDGAGRVYSFNYSGGLLSRISYKGSGTTELSYVAFTYNSSRLSTITDKDGKASNYTYSGNRLLTAQDIDGYRLTYSYNTVAGSWQPYRVLSVEESDGDAKAGKLTFVYGHNQTTITDHNGNTEIYQFNDWGNTVSIQDDEGHATFAKYARTKSDDTAGKANQLKVSSKLQNTVGNRLAASNFEKSNVWYTNSASLTATRTTEAAYSGSYSLKLTSSVSSTTAGLTDGFYVNPNETYIFSAYVKTVDAYAIIALQYGATYTTYTGSHLSPNHDWTRMEIVYTNTSEETRKITPILFITTSGTAYLDCAQVEKAPTPSRYNLVENGDFGHSTSWTISANCTDADTHTTLNTGKAPATQLQSTVFQISGDAQKTKSIQQNVAVSGSSGDSFVLAGWAKGDSAPLTSTETDAKIRRFCLKAIFNNTDGTKTERVVSFNPDTDSANSWQYVASPVISDKAYSSITVAAVYDYNVNTVYFDGIQLYKEEFGSSYTYDDKGNVKSVTDLQKQTTTYEYDTNSNLTKIIQDNKAKMTYTYDSWHNVKTATTDAGIVYSFTYDTYGNNTNVSIGSGNETISSRAEYTTDGNRLLYTWDALDKKTTYEYNENINVLEWMLNPNDTGSTRTEYIYDSMYRVEQVERVTHKANYTYTNDYLTKIQTPTTAYNFTYGDFGLRTGVSVGNRTLATYNYTEEAVNDRKYDLDRIDYSNGHSVEYEYDNKGRVTKQSYDNGDDTVTYTYDNSGNLAKVKDSATGRTTTYYYDLTDRMMKYVEKGTNYTHSVCYEYDTKNNLSKQVEEINGTKRTTTYTYDDDNRVKTVTTDGTTVEYTYDEDWGRLTTQVTKNSNGTPILTESFTYVNPNTSSTSTQIATYTTTTPGGYSVTYTYTYDDNGNITSVSYGTYTTSYVYDSGNQLIRENNEEGVCTFTWEYDKAGNILSSKEYDYDPEELNSLAFTFNYGYYDSQWGDLLTGHEWNVYNDELGNITDDGTWRYTWEHGRQLESMSDGNTTWTFQYDADGMRTKRTDDTTIYSYVYNGSQLTQMVKGADTLQFVYDAVGTPVSFDHNGTIYYYATNIQGDVVAILDESGASVVKYLYDAWGNEIYCGGSKASTIGNLNPLRYRSYVYDEETGLYYVSSRYYDPEIGRWINADSVVAGVGGDVKGYNLFAYCFNNPVNMDDQAGNWPKWIKSTVKWVAKNIVKLVVKTVQKTLSKVDLTYSTGVNVSGTPSAWIFNGQIGVSMDTKGNVAVQASGGGGVTGGTPSISISGYRSITNAPSINELNGMGYQIGGSAIIPVEGVPVAVGGDFNIIPDLERNRTYYGGTLTGGLAAGSPGGEFHVEWGTTVTLPKTQFNIYDVARSVYIKIMEW